MGLFFTISRYYDARNCVWHADARRQESQPHDVISDAEDVADLHDHPDEDVAESADPHHGEEESGDETPGSASAIGNGETHADGDRQRDEPVGRTKSSGDFLWI